MADLTAEIVHATTPRSGRDAFVVLNAKQLYAGAFIGVDAAGFATSWADTAGHKFIGMAETTVLGDSTPVAGFPTPRVSVDTSGPTLTGATVASVVQGSVNALVYSTTDNPLDLTLTAGTNVTSVGWVKNFVSAGIADVEVFTPAEATSAAEITLITSLTDSTGGSSSNTIADGFTQGAAFTDNTTGATTTTLAAGAGMYTLLFFTDLATVTDADIVTDYIIGHKFKLIKLDVIVETAATTASKLSTIDVEIGSTAVTGGDVDITSANMTPKGAVVAGAAITAANTGSNTATLTVLASSTTAFIEGSVWIALQIQNMDTADAFAGLVTQSNLARTDATIQNDADSSLAVKINEILAAT